MFDNLFIEDDYEDVSYKDYDSIVIENYLCEAALESSKPNKKPGKIRMSIANACKRLAEKCRKHATNARQKSHEKLTKMWEILAGWFDKMWKKLAKTSEEISDQKMEEIREQVEEKQEQVKKLESTSGSNYTSKRTSSSSIIHTVSPTRKTQKSAKSYYDSNQNLKNSALGGHTFKSSSIYTELRENPDAVMSDNAVKIFKDKIHKAKKARDHGDDKMYQKYTDELKATMKEFSSTLYANPEFTAAIEYMMGDILHDVYDRDVISITQLMSDF